MQITNGIISIYYRSAQCRHCLNARCTIQCYHFIILYSILVYTISLFFIKFKWWVKSHKNVKKSHIHLAIGAESHRIPFKFLMNRKIDWQNLEGFIYDNCCNLHRYLLNREAKKVENMRFLVDGCHFQGQKNLRNEMKKLEVMAILVAANPTTSCNTKSSQVFTKMERKIRKVKMVQLSISVKSLVLFARFLFFCVTF